MTEFRTDKLNSLIAVARAAVDDVAREARALAGRRVSEPTKRMAEIMGCEFVPNATGDDAALIEQFARAMFDEWPLHAISPAMAEQSGQEVGAPLTWEKVIEMGGDHNGLLRLARGVVKLHNARLSALKAENAVMLDILADVECALAVTREHAPEAEVGSFVDSSTQFKRLSDFLHSIQHRASLQEEDGYNAE